MMVERISPILPTTSRVSAWIEVICALISSVAFAVWVASDFTSLATTANPLPASPARAASMVALSASRFVCEAIWLMRPITSPILLAAAASPSTVSFVRWPSAAALLATCAACVTRWLISEIDADSSSAEEATVCTLPEACWQASSTACARVLAWSAVRDMLCAACCI